MDTFIKRDGTTHAKKSIEKTLGEFFFKQHEKPTSGDSFCSKEE
jgi:hypothetical protein